jgi:ligand-binding sensor domain-containing protein
VGTWSGAVFFDTDFRQVITSADGLADDMVNVMLRDTDGGMWFGSYTAPRGGISLQKDDQWQVFSTENGLPHNNVTSIIEDNAGNIRAGTGLLERGGGVKFSRTENSWRIEQVLTSDDGLAGNKVRSIFQDKDGVIWFGSEYDGLARLDNGTWRVLTEEDGLSNNEIMCMLQDSDGDLWMGTQDGITRVSYQALQDLR